MNFIDEIDRIQYQLVRPYVVISGLQIHHSLVTSSALFMWTSPSYIKEILQFAFMSMAELFRTLLVGVICEAWVVRTIPFGISALLFWISRFALSAVCLKHCTSFSNLECPFTACVTPNIELFSRVSLWSETDKHASELLTWPLVDRSSLSVGKNAKSAPDSSLVSKTNKPEFATRVSLLMRSLSSSWSLNKTRFASSCLIIVPRRERFPFSMMS